MQKEEKIKKLTSEEVKKIEKIFFDMENEVGTLGLALIDELKFSLQTLRKLKSDIRKNGVVTDMPQGNYCIKRTNPALQSYNTLIKNYQSLVKSILEMLPPESPLDDDFDNDDL